MLGHIDSVTLSGKNLNIQGWALDQKESICGYILSCGNRNLGFIEAEPRPSPDVKADYPIFSNSSQCRFSIDCTLPSDLSFTEQLISIKPVLKNVMVAGILFGRFQGEQFLNISEDISQSVGGGDSFEISLEFLNHFVRIGGLKSTDRVLDVGCGFGRMAIGLTQYLKPQTKYEGFDVSEKLISWAQKNITPIHPNFSFQRLDVFNGLYNSQGKFQDKEIIFPYSEKSFDFIVLASVFTQMLPEGVKNYLSEMNRVLRPGGRVFVSLFLINLESQALMDQEKSRQKLPFFKGDHSIASEENPDANVGYNEIIFKEWAKQAGFKVLDTHYGSWCGRHGLSYQDFVLLEKSE